MKWIKFGILTLALAAVWASQVGLAWAYTISINQYVEHPSLNDSVLGFKEALAELGIEAVYLEHNAQKSIATVLQIVNLMKDERPDLILAVSTPSAQSTVQGIKDIPVLFTCVTDPVNAGLVASMEKPGGNVSGTTDMNPVADQVALIREIQPEAKNLGVIYNPGEPNSVVQVSLLKKVAEKQGFIVVEGVAPDTAGVLQAAQSLVGRVDAIYLPTDNVVVSSMEAIINVALDRKIPIYPADDNSVRKGGVASISLNYYELGRLTGRMAAKILKDKVAPADLPVEALSNQSLVVNERFAEEISLPVPPSILERAKVVIK